MKSGGGAEAAVDPAGGQREAAERRQSAENVWGQVGGGRLLAARYHELGAFAQVNDGPQTASR